MKEQILEYIQKQDYRTIKKEFLELNEQDIADILENVEANEVVKIFRLLPKDIAADIFVYLPLDIQQEIITLVSYQDAGSFIDLLASDDAADLFDEMPANVVTRILSNTTPETRKKINELLKYPEDSAGSIMTMEYIDFKEDMTINEALRKIRAEANDKETISNCYVLDKNRKLLGYVDIKDIILAKSTDKITSIMQEQDIFLTTLEDQEQVAEKFKKYDVIVLPVLDSENRMIGIITVDDIVDIMEQETNEDIDKMAAITPTDKPYLNLSVFEIWKTRIPWLLILMISATFTSMIIQKYEAALASMVILTSYIPMFMDTAGNAGSQSSVTIIRSLATNEIEFKDFFKVLWKEFRISIFCGLTLSLCNYLKLIFIDRVSSKIALIVCTTLFSTVMFAKIIGSTLPLIAKKFKLDPAVMASPFITTITDAISLIVYFTIATKIIGI